MIRRGLILSLCAFLGACASQTSDRVALPAAPPPGEPPSTIGLSDAALRATFGAPAFVRRDGETEFWRYNGASCHAFFFLYKQSGILTVQHVETLPHGVSIAADSVCLQSIRLHPAVAPVS
jgi:hypothetical protein